MEIARTFTVEELESIALKLGTIKDACDRAAFTDNPFYVLKQVAFIEAQLDTVRKAARDGEFRHLPTPIFDMKGVKP